MLYGRRADHVRKRWLPPGLLSERNVTLSFAFAVFGALVSTIAHGQIFTVFIFELFGDNTSVGITESISGVVALATAVPVGMAVDRVSRAKLLRQCAVVGFLAAAFGALATCLGPWAVTGPNFERRSPGRGFQLLLLIALSLWGVFFNAATSASQALFADSVPQGQVRRDLYATKSTLTLLTLAVGPLFALGCTWVLGNDWKLYNMVYMILPGFVAMIPMCFLMMFFEEVGLPRSSPLRAALLPSASQKAARAPAPPRRARPPVEGAWMVPYLLLAAELITSIGAGMTVKFFGLWFKNVYHFSPFGLAALQAATPVCIAATVQLLQLVAGICPWGPVPAMLLFWLVSICALLGMTRVSDWRVLVVLHLVRCAFANCKEPLARAIMADFVPSDKRGRWNAFHSLTGMTWTGSAALGGVLCDRYGYGKTFMITAGLYCLAGSLWIPLVRLVPHEKPAADNGAEAEDDQLKSA